MQIARKRLSALALGMCLLVASAFGTSTAMAAEVDWPYDGENTLTVVATESSDELIIEELDEAGVSGRLTLAAYFVAYAVPHENDQAYTYVYNDPFGSGEVPVPLVDDSRAADKWKALAADAMEHVEEANAVLDDPWIDLKYIDTGGVRATYAAQNMPCGLYLIVVNPHSDEPNVLRTEQNTYTFSPTIVALPTKAPDENGVIASSNDGKWDNSLTAVLKPSKEIRYGSLTIKKTVVNSGGYAVKPISFVFKVVDAETGGEKYTEYKEILYDGSSSNPSAVLSGIPAGMEVRVTEEKLNEAAWGLISDNDQTAVIVADTGTAIGGASVSFKNEYIPAKGFAVENTFELQKIGEGEGDWDWKWIQVTPESARTDQGA